MKTLVIFCFDPRATEIPQAVAGYFGDEVYLTTRATGLDLRKHCLPQPTRVDSPPLLKGQ